MNYYEILEIPQNSTSEDIRKSYKRLAAKYHPDLYDGDLSFANEKMKSINMAYDTLSNNEKRIAYDAKINEEAFKKKQKSTEQNSYQSHSEKDFDQKNSYSNSSANYSQDDETSFWGKIKSFVDSIIGLVVLLVIISLITGNFNNWFGGIFRFISGLF